MVMAHLKFKKLNDIVEVVLVCSSIYLLAYGGPHGCVCFASHCRKLFHNIDVLLRDYLRKCGGQRVVK